MVINIFNYCRINYMAQNQPASGAKKRKTRNEAMMSFRTNKTAEKLHRNCGFLQNPPEVKVLL
jgi:hypothetical protein